MFIYNVKTNYNELCLFDEINTKNSMISKLQRNQKQIYVMFDIFNIELYRYNMLYIDVL